jgi:hypothetical protein
VGRPPLDPEDQRSERVVVHLRRADFDALARMAKAKGAHVGQLAREILERHLRRK